MRIILVFMLVLLPIFARAEYKITETDQGVTVEYSGDAAPVPAKVTRTKAELDNIKFLEGNLGKKFWTTKHNTSFYEFPKCKDKIALSQGQWFTVRSLMVNKDSKDLYHQLSSPRYEVNLDTDLVACFSPLFHGNIDNNIDIFKEDKNQLQLELLAKFHIAKGKVLWTKYPFKGYPAFTKLKIKDIKVEADNSISCEITIIAEINNVSQTISTNSMYTLAGQFDETDPKKAISKWPKKILDAVSRMKIMLGMTTAQVKASWGEPESVNRTVGSWGVNEQWVYGSRRYLYFRNGILTSWQD